jgi:hypothetical protein
MTHGMGARLLISQLATSPTLLWWEVCGAEIVFVTASVEQTTLDRIKERVPGAQVVAKPVAPKRLAEAAGRVIQPQREVSVGESPDDRQ